MCSYDALPHRMSKKANSIIPVQQVEHLIFIVRGQKVMLDSDLAALYGAATKVLNQAVRRNNERFPEDFMFQLSKEECGCLLTQIAVSGEESALGNRSQIVTGSQKHRDPRFRPYAFTEQGIAMLSSVLRSPRAVKVNIEIMRAFVKIRQWLASNAELSQRLNALEQKYDGQFKLVFDAIRSLMQAPAHTEPRKEIGFHSARNSSKPKPQNKIQARTTF